MVVYADILICLNTVVTYFILLAVKAVNNTTVKVIRIVFASLIGGCSSLYILLPQQSIFIELLIKLVISAVITVTAFGTAPFKKTVRGIFFFFAVSFIYAGFMLGFWYILKPNGMVINNGVVYFQISPAVLILSTVICYFAIMLFKKFLRRKDTFSESKAIKILYNGRQYTVDCMVDSGNTVSDPMGSCKVIIVDKKTAENIFGRDNVYDALRLNPEKSTQAKFRVIPYKTVSGDGLMPAIRVDGAEADGEKIHNVLIGITDSSFDGDISGIISADFCN